MSVIPIAANLLTHSAERNQNKVAHNFPFQDRIKVKGWGPQDGNKYTSDQIKDKKGKAICASMGQNLVVRVRCPFPRVI